MQVNTVEIILQSIGVIHSPFRNSDGVPIQSYKSKAIGRVEIDRAYVEGLKSLDGFSHIILLYWFHHAKDPKMEVMPFLDTQNHGKHTFFEKLSGRF